MTTDTLACTVCGSTLRMCGHWALCLVASPAFAREPWLRNRIAEIIHSGTTATDRVSLAVLCGGVACLVVTLALLVAVWRGR